MSQLSIVIPAYNEEAILTKTAATINQLMKENGIHCQLIFIDDGSKDNTWKRIEEAADTHNNISGVHFSRNFGKEAAIFAGLAYAKGDCVAVMDCDLQHPPEVLVKMYSLWKEGYEVIEGIKKSRGEETVFHSFSARLFYKIMSKAVNIDMSKASDFKLMDRKVVDALLAMPERNAFFRAMSSWVGFTSATVEFDVQEREAGESKWSTKSLIRYAVTNIAAFSSAPMQIVTVAGILTFFFALIMSIQTLIKFFTKQAVEGFTTVILLQLLLGSVIMISLGIIGYYISKVYEEQKQRPRYIISKTVGPK